MFVLALVMREQERKRKRERERGRNTSNAGLYCSDLIHSCHTFEELPYHLPQIRGEQEPSLDMECPAHQPHPCFGAFCMVFD